MSGGLYCPFTCKNNKIMSDNITCINAIQNVLASLDQYTCQADDTRTHLTHSNFLCTLIASLKKPTYGVMSNANTSHH